VTSAQVAQAIRANVDALYDSGRSWEDFDAEQQRLWRYADSRSRRFVDLVAAQVAPPARLPGVPQ
jgi:hypothetical protein